jgi:hypothetical protein
MAVDYIKVTIANNSRATKAIRLINMIREVQDTMKQVKAYVDHSSADPDFSGLEAAFGLAAGQGGAFNTLLLAARTRLNHADVDAFIDRVGE